MQIYIEGARTTDAMAQHPDIVGSKRHNGGQSLRQGTFQMGEGIGWPKRPRSSVPMLDERRLWRSLAGREVPDRPDIVRGPSRHTRQKGLPPTE